MRESQLRSRNQQPFVFNAMMAGKTENFQNLFRAFFVAGIGAYQRLAQQLQDREDWFRLNFIIDPIIDVMEISGY